MNLRAANKYNLTVLHPELAREWHLTKNGSLNPSNFSPGSSKKIVWKCKKCGHEWKTKISHRARTHRNKSEGSKCPICVQESRSKKLLQTILKKRGSLAETNPNLTKEWHPTKNGNLTPFMVTYANHKKIWWKCTQDSKHEWQSQINNRTIRGDGCKECNQLKRKQS